MASFASSYIPTTTASVTRNADILTYPTAGNFSDTAGVAYAEYQSPAMTITNAMRIIGDSAGAVRTPLATRIITRGITSVDNGGNGPFGAAGTPLNNTKIKGASVWGAGSMKVISNGAFGTPTAYSGSFALSGLGIGGTYAIFSGNIRNVKIWKNALTDAQLIDLTR